MTLPDDRKFSVDADECRLFLIVTLATALTFCLLSACIVLYACYRRCREHSNTKANTADTASIRSGSSAGFRSVTTPNISTDTKTKPKPLVE